MVMNVFPVTVILSIVWNLCTALTSFVRGWTLENLVFDNRSIRFCSGGYKEREEDRGKEDIKTRVQIQV